MDTHARRLGQQVAGILVALALVLVTAGPAHAQIEDYAGYQPPTKCSPKAKPGTKELASWLVRRGGGYGPISRACKSGGVSEHKEGRAFDWALDATKKGDRAIAKKFLEVVRATDADGNPDAKARRMGIMYIIWNDHMWSAWDGFQREGYLSASCKSIKKCSKTLRHRDHMHISLSRKGGRGETSWYAGRL